MQTVSVLEPARISAIEKLQSYRSRYSPGSFLHEVADHAIDLALSPRRKADGFLVRNAWRDSKRILSRQMKNGPTVLSLDEEFSINGHDGGENEVMSLHDRCASPGLFPDQVCLENDFEAVLRHLLGDTGPVLFALDCVKHGGTAKDFSQETGMSTSYFKKLKKTISAAAAAALN